MCCKTNSIKRNQWNLQLSYWNDDVTIYTTVRRIVVFKIVGQLEKLYLIIATTAFLFGHATTSAFFILRTVKIDTRKFPHAIMQFHRKACRKH